MGMTMARSLLGSGGEKANEAHELLEIADVTPVHVWQDLGDYYIKALVPERTTIRAVWSL